MTEINKEKIKKGRTKKKGGRENLSRTRDGDWPSRSVAVNCPAERKRKEKEKEKKRKKK